MGFKSSFITFFLFFLLIFRFYLLFGCGYQRSHIVLLNLRLFTHLSSFYLSLISLVPFKNNLNLDSFLYLMSRNHVFVLILSSFWFLCLFLSLLIMHDMKLCLLFTYWILDFFCCFSLFLFFLLCVIHVLCTNYTCFHLFCALVLHLIFLVLNYVALCYSLMQLVCARILFPSLHTRLHSTFVLRTRI